MHVLVHRRRASLAKDMGVPGYETKVPENIRAENANQAAKLDAELTSIDEAIANFERLAVEEQTSAQS